MREYWGPVHSYSGQLCRAIAAQELTTGAAEAFIATASQPDFFCLTPLPYFSTSIDPDGTPL